MIGVVGKSVRLKYRPSCKSVRRVYARERVRIDPYTAANVPVKMPLTNLQSPVCDWATEPRQLRTGLIVGSTMVPNDDTYAAMHVINLSGKCRVEKKCYLLGEAQPGIVCDDVQVPGDELNSEQSAQCAPEVLTVAHCCGTGNNLDPVAAQCSAVPGQSLGHSSQNASNVNAEVKNYSTSHILATDLMREAKTINLDNSAKFHFSEVINQFPYRTDFSSPAISCEIGFSDSSREINSLALSSEKNLRDSDNRLVAELSHDSHHSRNSHNMYNSHNSHHTHDSHISHGSHNLYDSHVRKLAGTVPRRNERSTSVLNIAPDYVPTASTVPIPDGVQSA